MKITVADKIAIHKAAWAEICRAMDKGYWRGTEADALAAIEACKAEIAELEKTQ